jgi:hypothetical protein
MQHQQQNNAMKLTEFVNFFLDFHSNDSQFINQME